MNFKRRSGMKSKVLYLIGSLRNDRIPKLGIKLRKEFAVRGIDCEVFDDWHAAGPEADDHWKEYEQRRGRTYKEALNGKAAKNVFRFDRENLDRATHVLLVLPAGKSGHMEVMYGKYGVGAKAAILLDPEDVRWDVMYQFVDDVIERDEDVIDWIAAEPHSEAGENDGEKEHRGRADEIIADLVSSRGRQTPR